MGMAQVRRFCPVLMIPSLVGLLSAVAVAYAKLACNGDTVKLFDDIQIKDSGTSATLYKHGEYLGWWTIEDHSFTNHDNFVMDRKKNVWIINVHLTDEAIYHIQYMTNGKVVKDETQDLSVLVAPNNNCQISVNEREQTLTVGLTSKDKDDCGRPQASAYWKYYTGVNVHDEKFLELQSVNEAGTYYACMKGTALRCANSSDPSTNFCVPYYVNKGRHQSSTSGSTTQLSSDGSKDSILIAILVLQRCLFY